MDAPLVSIIVPIYNAKGMVKKCVKRLKQQELEDLEIILVDDGSQDGTFVACLEAARGDSRVKVAYQSNAGAAAARNLGLSLAKGKYACFVDVDDEPSRGLARKAAARMEGTGADIAAFGMEWADAAGRPVKVSLLPDKAFSGEYIRTHYSEFGFAGSEHFLLKGVLNKMYRREFLMENSLGFPGLRHGEDMVFNLGCLSCAKSVCCMGDVLYRYFPCSMEKEREKYAGSFLHDAIGCKAALEEALMEWAPGDKEALSCACNDFAVSMDCCIRMAIGSLPPYAVVKKYREAKRLAGVFRAEVPTMDFEPAFQKCKYMKEGKHVRLLAAEILKGAQLRIEGRKLR